MIMSDHCISTCKSIRRVGLIDYFFLKGAMLGGVVGMLSTTWLSIGSLTVTKNHHPLPPVSVEQCYHGNSSYTLLNLITYTSAEILHSYSITDNWNQTMDVLPTSESQTVCAIQTAVDNIVLCI